MHLVKLQTGTPVSVTNTSTAYNMRARPLKRENCHRTSDRPRRKVDYSELMAGNEDDTSPPHKKRTVDLKRKPSSSRIASQNYHTKPSSTPRPVRRPQSATITTPASSEETRIAIDALLSLGNDVIPELDITAENSALMPVGKKVPSRDNDNSIELPENQNIKDADQSTAENPTPPALPPAPAQNQPSDSIDEDTSRTNNTTVDSTDSQHSKSNTTPNNKKKKGTLVTRNFALPRRTRPNRSFRCSIENCNQKFGSVKDLNQHHRDHHPPVKCDMCTESFSCPNEMLKHKYKHYEIMFECIICEKGFTFESQFIAHKMKHRKSPGHQCITCKKWFMRDSELTAHLIIHGKKYTYCTEPGCDYKNKDPRNVRAHARRHSAVLSFKCSKCNKRFKWCAQRKRHMENNCK